MAMLSDHEDEIIVRSTIELAHRLGLRTVAEGVETEDAWRRLAELGCDEAQGYLLMRPTTGDDLLDWLREREIAPPLRSRADELGFQADLIPGAA